MVERALLEGKQTVLIRKGGLIDGPAGFRPEHSSFYIYPTFHHQQRRGVKEEFKEILASVSQDDPNPSEVTFSVFAEVKEFSHIDSEEELQKVSKNHILNSAELKRRFDYGKARGINLLFLSVFRLDRPVHIPVLPHFSGCRSWVDLGRPLKGGKSVLIGSFLISS